MTYSVTGFWEASTGDLWTSQQTRWVCRRVAPSSDWQVLGRLQIGQGQVSPSGSELSAGRCDRSACSHACRRTRNRAEPMSRREDNMQYGAARRQRRPQQNDGQRTDNFFILFTLSWMCFFTSSLQCKLNLLTAERFIRHCLLNRHITLLAHIPSIQYVPCCHILTCDYAHTFA